MGSTFEYDEMRALLNRALGLIGDAVSIRLRGDGTPVTGTLTSAGVAALTVDAGSSHVLTIPISAIASLSN